MKKIIKIPFLSLMLLLLLSSCAVTKRYERDENVVEQQLFRTDMLAKDSLSFGHLSWKDIFTDAQLQEHIEIALENNLDIRVAAQNILIAEAYLKQSKANYLPAITIGPNYTFSTQSLNTQFGRIIGERRYINQFDITANLNWELDVFGKMSAQKRAQFSSYLSSVAAHQTVKSDLVSSIASAYYQLVIFDEQKQIIQQTIGLRKQTLETTKALKEAGVLTEVAVQQSEALVYNAEALLVNLDVQITLLENTINFLKGMPSQKIARNRSSSIQIKDVELGYAVSLLENRPDVRMAEQQLINAFELTNVAKTQFYPTFKITGSGGLQSIDIDHFFSVNSFFSSIVSGLLQPVFNKRQIRTEYEVSLSNKEKAYLNFRKVILNAGKEVSDALKTYESQDEIIALKEKEAKAYKNAVEYSQELVNYGMANYLEVINASVNALNTELDIANAKFTKIQACIALYKALGGGWR